MGILYREFQGLYRGNIGSYRGMEKKNGRNYLGFRDIAPILEDQIEKKNGKLGQGVWGFVSSHLHLKSLIP